MNNSKLILELAQHGDHTIHARRNWADNISDESVLYLNPDKKRTKAWFHGRGTDVPLDGIKFGSIRSIADIFPDDNAFTKESVNGTFAGKKITPPVRRSIG